MLIMNDALWAELRRVNAIINRRVGYQTDLELYDTPELWVVADRRGDCEDYALAKRKMLLGLGWPLDALKLAVCADESGSGHAVLTIDCDKGVYVLDNRHAGVMPWKDLPYRWLRRQSGRGWVNIEG
jgi:predicted transglutaminase-like cysteine proteinase